ncbi:MAG: DUF721 domain-containing protein [Bacteroidales bacterium]
MAIYSEPTSLKDLLDQVLKDNNLDKKLLKTKIEQLWFDINEEDIAKHTKRVYYEDSILTVILDNSSIKNNLIYNKSELLSKINEILGDEIVKKIKII